VAVMMSEKIQELDQRKKGIRCSFFLSMVHNFDRLASQTKSNKREIENVNLTRTAIVQN
jgi:hypothetical protein